MAEPATELPDVESVVDGVGAQLRSLRRSHALTLAQLSTATGIALSTLSRLEAGQRRASLDVLLKLARIYRVTLDELVAAPATGDPRVHPTPTTRYGMTWLPLTRNPGGLQAYKLIIPAGFPSREPEQRSHPGYEWIYVLHGRIRLLLGEHDLTLTAGEVAELDTRTPHAFTNPTTTPVELLLLLGADGQRAHVRARPRRSPPKTTAVEIGNSSH